MPQTLEKPQKYRNVGTQTGADKEVKQLKDEIKQVTKDRKLLAMKYETFKKRLAKLLNQANPDEEPIEHRNGAKLFDRLQKDLLGTVKLSK